MWISIWGVFNCHVWVPPGRTPRTIPKQVQQTWYPQPLLQPPQESALGSQLSHICLKKLKMQVIKPRIEVCIFFGFLPWKICEIRKTNVPCLLVILTRSPIHMALYKIPISAPSPATNAGPTSTLCPQRMLKCQCLKREDHWSNICWHVSFPSRTLAVPSMIGIVLVPSYSYSIISHTTFTSASAISMLWGRFCFLCNQNL